MRRLTALAALGLAAVLLTGCAQANDSILGGWGAPADQREPNLDFTKDGRVTGSDGCNTLNGSWKADGDVISVSDVAQTLVACEDVDTWLSGIASVKVAGDHDSITVYDKDGKKIGALDRRD